MAAIGSSSSRKQQAITMVLVLLWLGVVVVPPAASCGGHPCMITKSGVGTGGGKQGRSPRTGRDHQNRRGASYRRVRPRRHQDPRRRRRAGRKSSSSTARDAWARDERKPLGKNQTRRREKTEKKEARPRRAVSAGRVSGRARVWNIPRVGIRPRNLQK